MEMCNSNVTISPSAPKMGNQQGTLPSFVRVGHMHSAKFHDMEVPYRLSLPPDGQHTHNFLSTAQCTQVVLRGRHADCRRYRPGQTAPPHLLQQPLWLLSR